MALRLASASRRLSQPIARWVVTTSRSRGASYNTITEADITHFRRILPHHSVVTDPEEVQKFNIDWMNSIQGDGTLVLKPQDTSQISAILSYCNERRLAVVPQGGNTGLVGGSVPLYDEIILSLSNMDSVVGFDTLSSVLTCQAGCVLQNLDEWLEPHGHMMPLDLGAKGSCQIGGNISTSAGGIRFLRHGSLRGSVLGLEVVLADGRVLDLLTSLRKDNTGYDLKQLFIGSEGTLGVVTAAAIAVPRLPSSVQVALLACPSYSHLLDAVSEARSTLGEILSAVEYADCAALQRSMTLPGKHAVFSEEHPFYLLIETQGSNQDHDIAKFMAFLESSMESGLATDGILAQDSRQAAHIWSLREDIPMGVTSTGYMYKYDVSLPLSDFPVIVDEVRARTDSLDCLTVGYGHLGDANLHINTCTPGCFQQRSEVLAALEPFVYEFVRDRGGSVSAEHGIGSDKLEYLPFSKPDSAIELMAQMKDLMDPNHILNPYKVIPPQSD